MLSSVAPGIAVHIGAKGLAEVKYKLEGVDDE